MRMRSENVVSQGQGSIMCIETVSKRFPEPKPSLPLDYIGETLAIMGSIASITGALLNNLSLMHVEAMWLWMLSNPLLLAWSYGCYKKWWNGGISIEAIGIMYAIFTVTNFYGLTIA